MNEPQEQTASADMVNKFVALGREKQLGAGATLLGLIGFFAPLASAQTGGYFGAQGEISYGLSQAGFVGVLVLALTLALGLAPFFLPVQRRNNVIYYGVAAACLGSVLSVWLVSLSLPMAISAIGHLAIGFYALLASFAISTYQSATRCFEAEVR